MDDWEERFPYNIISFQGLFSTPTLGEEGMAGQIDLNDNERGLNKSLKLLSFPKKSTEKTCCS